MSQLFDSIYQNMPGAEQAYNQLGVPPVLTQTNPYATAGYLAGVNGNVAPLVGYPSAYPHVLNGTPQDYAAQYVGPNFLAGGTYGYDPSIAASINQSLTDVILSGISNSGRSSGGTMAQAPSQQTAVDAYMAAMGVDNSGTNMPMITDAQMVPPPSSDNDLYPPNPPALATLPSHQTAIPAPTSDPVWDMYTQYGIWSTPFQTPEEYALARGYEVPAVNPEAAANDTLAGVSSLPLVMPPQAAVEPVAPVETTTPEVNTPSALSSIDQQTIANTLRAAILATPELRLAESLGNLLGIGRQGSPIRSAIQNAPATNWGNAALPPPTILPTPAGPIFIP